MHEAPEQEAASIDWAAYQRARSELGASFVRILGYFDEDGAKAVGQIEAAMRAGQAAAMILPAHTLKGEAHQFGAKDIAARAERIETIARECLERRETPSDALPYVVGLRDSFERTLDLLAREANPLVARRAPQSQRRA